VAYPDHIRLEAKLPFGVIQQGYDGKSGWIASPQGTMDAPATLQGEFPRLIAMSGAVGLYQQVLAGQQNSKFQYLGQEDIDGKKADAVEWSVSFGPVKFYFDPATHLLVAAHFRQVSPQGAAEVDQHWSDYKAVEGVQIAFAVTVLRDGAKYTESTVQEVKLNPAIDPAVFNKPK